MNGIRIPISLVIEMDDQQIADYAAEYGLPQQPTGHYRAKDIVDDVRRYVLTAVQDSAAFGEASDGQRAATVSIKGG